MPKRYIDNNNEESSDSENDVCEKGEYIRDNFTLEDFVAFDKTRNILHQNYIWEFDKECGVLLENFYKGEVKYCQRDQSTLFANEKDQNNYGYFENLVFNHVKPKYELDLLYNNPDLCTSFLDFNKDRVEEIEKERLRVQRENYSKTKNANKTFDWTLKTHK